MRHGLSIIAALFPLMAAASAQAQGLEILLREVEGRSGSEMRTLVNVPVGARECRENVGIGLRINNIPRDANTLEFWRAGGEPDSAIPCNEIERRDGSTAVGQCTQLMPGVDTATRGSQLDLDGIPIANLLPCDPDEPKRSSYSIFVLAVTGEMEEVASSHFGVWHVRQDTEVPRPPAGLRVREGETAFSLDWDVDEGPRDLREHRVYGAVGCQPDVSTDAGTGTPGSDGGTAPMDASLSDGAIADGGPMDGSPDDGGTGSAETADAGDGGGDAGSLDGGVGSAQQALQSCNFSGDSPGLGIGSGFMLLGCTPGTTGNTSVRVDELGFDVPVGSQLTLAVTGIDEAKNESQPAAECATRRETTSYCEGRFGGDCPGSWGCATPPAGPLRGGSLVWAVLGAAALTLVSRRRRSRR